MVVARASVTAALTALLVLSPLSMVAAQVAAPPPEPAREATTGASSDVAAGAEAEAGSPLTIPQNLLAPLPDPGERLAAASTPSERTDSGFSSVRLRGLEAPVELKATKKNTKRNKKIKL